MNLRELKSAIASAEKHGATDETEVMLLPASVGLQRSEQAMVWKRQDQHMMVVGKVNGLGRG
jgi:hypothetical protein